ncbi:MAG: archease [Merismopedia sp. SIO2A8]|nr:archease [Symploca sp. SIO2B6]NET51445.1 archease [Merismopedia sp. SIO2A8]
MVAWLHELLYLHEIEGLGLKHLNILHLAQRALHAHITSASVWQWLKDIKAATYNNLAILSTESSFEVTTSIRCLMPKANPRQLP